MDMAACKAEKGTLFQEVQPLLAKLALVLFSVQENPRVFLGKALLCPLRPISSEELLFQGLNYSSSVFPLNTVSVKLTYQIPHTNTTPVLQITTGKKNSLVVFWEFFRDSFFPDPVSKTLFHKDTCSHLITALPSACLLLCICHYEAVRQLLIAETCPFALISMPCLHMQESPHPSY